eukprot:1932708-Ditylum_brightwellii.AAC.1
MVGGLNLGLFCNGDMRPVGDFNVMTFGWARSSMNCGLTHISAGTLAMSNSMGKIMNAMLPNKTSCCACRSPMHININTLSKTIIHLAVLSQTGTHNQ